MRQDSATEAAHRIKLNSRPSNLLVMAGLAPIYAGANVGVSQLAAVIFGLIAALTYHRGNQSSRAVGLDLPHCFGGAAVLAGCPD